MFSGPSGEGWAFDSGWTGFEVLQIGEDLHHLMNEILVVLPEELYQVMLFKLDADEDEARSGYGEQQMPIRHVRPRPESDDEPKHNGVPNALVEASGLESSCFNS